MSDDLVKRLRDLAQAKHDDLSIGDEAAARIAELEATLQKKGCARDQNTTQFCAEAAALQARVVELEGALDQLLDDMRDGLCVCEQAKEEARAALEGKKS